MVGRGQVRLCRAEASEVIKEKKMGNSSIEKPELRCNQSHSTKTLGKTSQPATVICVPLFLHQLPLYPLAHTFLSKWADRMTQLVRAQPWEPALSEQEPAEGPILLPTINVFTGQLLA